MSDIPNIAICIVTFQRTSAALETIRSTIENLDYPKEKRGFYIADDGSPKEHMESILDLLSSNGEKIIGSHSERLRLLGQEESYHAGLGWNKGLGLCHQNSDFVLWLEDDWRLENKLDLLPHIRLLQSRADVGLVSYRILSAGNDVETVGYEGRMYLKYLRNKQYSYSGNPYLRHARFTTAYGWFAEDRNPGLMELGMDDQYRLRDGPDIWRPADISVWGSWVHIGSEKSWK